MAALISRTRDLISDPAGISQVFSDDDIQGALDRRRLDVRYLELTWAEQIGAGGAVSYLDYWAPVGEWEGGETLQGGNWQTLTATTVDRALGKWTFASSTAPPVFLTGQTYDIYRAAVDLLRQWKAKLKLTSYDFSSDGQSFSRKQRLEAIDQLVADYLGQARAVSMTLGRGDDVSCW